MRGHCRWILGATLSVALTVGANMFAALPAHAQSVTGLGQAGPQVDRCQLAVLAGPICGANIYESGGAGWQPNTPLIEPAVGLAPAVCRRGAENE